MRRLYLAPVLNWFRIAHLSHLHSHDQPDLVVAAYQESLSWLTDIAPRVNHIHV